VLDNATRIPINCSDLTQLFAFHHTHHAYRPNMYGPCRLLCVLKQCSNSCLEYKE